MAKLAVHTTIDGYMIGATRDIRRGIFPDYWGCDDRDCEIAIWTVDDPEIASHLINQGTSDQEYRDGYEATSVLLRNGVKHAI